MNDVNERELLYISTCKVKYVVQWMAVFNYSGKMVGATSGSGLPRWSAKDAKW